MDTSAYFQSLNGELQSLKNRVRGIIANKHWGEDGKWRESVLRSMLRRQLPENVLVGSGFILCPTGEISSQQDIILYTADSPVLFRDGDTVILESTCVIGIIEVKSSLDKTRLEEAVEKLSKTLEKSYNYGIVTGLFCYDKIGTANYKDTIANSIRNFSGSNPERMIDFFCFGSNDFVHWWDFVPIKGENMGRRAYQHWHHYCFGDDLAVGYFIHNFIERCTQYLRKDGASFKREWWYPEDTKESSLVQKFSPLALYADNPLGENHD